MKPHHFPCWLACFLFLPFCSIQSQERDPTNKHKLGLFEQASDIGSVSLSGASQYNPASQSYELSGSGSNIWGNKDEFHMVWKKVRGDFILDAKVTLVGKGVDPHRKLGWMIRSNLEGGSSYADVAVHGDGLASLQFRKKQDGPTEQIVSVVKAPDVIRLTRSGQRIAMRVAKEGDLFETSDEINIDLGNEVYVGLYICSHNADVIETGKFSNVRITIPAPDNLRQYRDYIGSRLEILDIQTLNRNVLQTAKDAIQAPNWAPDGKSLIYNRNGKLYRFELEGMVTSEVNTDFATRNLNDHVVSPDGKRIGLSHNNDHIGGKSMIYTIPIAGGVPKLITKSGPSFLHSWSPDSSMMLYTGDRDGNYDIYRIPSQGGDEVQLTSSLGVDDGSEFTPDGSAIYFNSERTGRMQIWKMNVDGTNPVKVTDDGFNNWFPHVSPDGKSLVVLSYTSEIKPSEHPYYKSTYLRILPLDGGQPRVIAYIYGGQGTINVNSWSPDGKRLAFVSNSVVP